MNAIRLQRDIHIRPPSLGDAASVAGLINLLAMLETGALQTSVEAVRAHWQSTLQDANRDEWLVENRAGEVIGYLEVLGGCTPQTPFVWVWLHPDYATSQIGVDLFTLAERRVRERCGEPVTLRTATINVNHAARRMLGQQGFHLAERYWHGQDGATVWSPLGMPDGRLPYRYDVYEKELCPGAAN